MFFGGEFAQRHAADAFDDDGQQREAGVAVHVFFAGLEVQRLLAHDHGHDVVVGDEVLRIAPAGQPEQRPLIAKSAGVVQQVTEGDALAEIGQFGNVFVDIVVEGELPLLRKQKDGGGRELLGHGGDVEDGRRGDGDVIVQVGHAVAVLVDDLTILVDAQGAARRIRLVPLREDLVHLVVTSGGRVCACGRDEIRKMATKATPDPISFILISAYDFNFFKDLP